MAGLSELEGVINLQLLEQFARGTIVPSSQTLNILAVVVNALADARVTTEQGADGLRYWNEKLQYSTESYNEVTPEGNENPSEEGWYVLIDGAYVITTDTVVSSGRTYYSLQISWTDIKLLPSKVTYFADTKTIYIPDNIGTYENNTITFDESVVSYGNNTIIF